MKSVFLIILAAFGGIIIVLIGCFTVDLRSALTGSPVEAGMVVVSGEVVLIDAEVGRYGGGVVPTVLSVFTEDKFHAYIKEVVLIQVRDNSKIVRKKFFWHKSECAIFSGLSPGTYRLYLIKANHTYTDEGKTEFEFLTPSDTSAKFTFEVLPGKVKNVNLIIKREMPCCRGDRPRTVNHTLKDEDVYWDARQESEFWNALLTALEKKQVSSPWLQPMKERLSELNELISSSPNE